MTTIVLAHWRDLSPSPLNSEVRGAISEDEIIGLAESILEQGGVIQPLNVTPLGDGRYQIITGERRWHAAKYLGDEAPLLSCQVNENPGDEIDQLVTMGVENLQRANLSPIAEGRYYDALRKRGLDEKAIARRTGQKLSRIKQHLELLELPAPVQEHFDTKRLPLSAHKVLKQLPEELQIEVANKTIGRSLTEIERVVGFVQAKRERDLVKYQVNGNGHYHHNETPAAPPETIQYDNLLLAVRATCAACESYQLIPADLKWEQVATSLNGTCDACEVKGLKAACELCPLVDFLKFLKKLHNGQGAPVGPPHLYKIGVLK